jgi:hypothetical protein
VLSGVEGYLLEEPSTGDACRLWAYPLDGRTEMNWDALAAIGEIVGAGAVLATLGFLAVQIRDGQRLQEESNLLARSAASDKAFDQFTDFRRLLAAGPDVTRIRLAGCSEETLEALNPLERSQFNGIIAGMVRSVENIHYQYVTGGIDRELCAGWELRTRSIVGQPGGPGGPKTRRCPQRTSRFWSTGWNQWSPRKAQRFFRLSIL